jgi:hypothetical protein
MQKSLFFGIAALVVIAGALALIIGHPRSTAPVSNADDTAVRAAITGFGGTLKNVSLLAPDASTQIATEYAPYASPALIAKWQGDPEHAPGRLTSSPWPDRIEVSSVDAEGDTARASGTLVEATSANGGAATGSYAVTFTLEKENGTWLITGYEKGAEQPQAQNGGLMQHIITGTWECLPHKDTSGPQTMECALGIKEDGTGDNYSIDTSGMEGGPVDYPTGTHLKVTGTLTAAEALNDSHWQIYDMVGIIHATSIEKI